MSKCRVSKDKLETIIDFGNIYLNNFVKEKDYNLERGKLRIGFSKKSKLVQLLDTANQDKLYTQYWYRSGTNETMTNQLYDVVDNMSLWAELKENDIVLDIDVMMARCLKDTINMENFLKLELILQQMLWKR